MQEYFDIVRRNPYHWDIWAYRSDGSSRRVYKIRGSKYDIVLQGDHEFSSKPERNFANIQYCMIDVITEFMEE